MKIILDYFRPRRGTWLVPIMESDDCKICECQVSGQGRALDIILDIIIGWPQPRRIFVLFYILETTLQVRGSGTAHLLPSMVRS